MSNSKLIQSVSRACDILDFIAAHDNNVRLNELSIGLGIAKTTLFGILATLETKGLLLKTKNGAYKFGLKCYTYGKLYEREFNIKNIVHPYLVSLRDQYNESAHLAIEENSQILYIDRACSSYAIRVESNIGGRDPMYCSSIGKVMLSYKTEKELDQYFETCPLKPKSPNTITDPNVLRTQLKQIRKQGYAVDWEELESGLLCVAAPILSNNTVLAAISLSGPRQRISNEWFGFMCASIVKTANSISEML